MLTVVSTIAIVSLLLAQFSNRQTIGRRYIDIIPATRTEYYEAVSIVSVNSQTIRLDFRILDKCLYLTAACFSYR